MKMNIDYKRIGKRIKIARKDMGITQEQLAERTCLSTNHISHVEIGSVPLSLPALVSICEVLHVTADQLLYDNLTEVNPYILHAQLENCFMDATTGETKVMLAAALAVKEAMRLG